MNIFGNLRRNLRLELIGFNLFVFYKEIKEFFLLGKNSKPMLNYFTFQLQLEYRQYH